MRRYLTIDGDFFCHRVIHGMRSINPDITLDSNGEMMNFKNALYDSLKNLYTLFVEQNLCQNIIFVFDSKSWRKDVKPFKPYYITDDTSIGYKDNRKEKADESTLNFDSFNLVKSEFAKELLDKQIIPVFRISGLEGDDSLLCLRDKLLADEKSSMFIFCTDGDLKQLLHYTGKADNIMLYRNIKSKAAPDGEIIIKKELFDVLYGGTKDVLDVFFQNASGVNSPFLKEQLFKVSFKGPGLSTDRKPAEGIGYATPTLNLLVKIICGDKKDNIFPIIRWSAKTGTRNYSITENHIKKGFENLDMPFNEESVIELMSDKVKMSGFLYCLFDAVKQEFNPEQIKQIAAHYRHNRELLDIRTTEYIPKQYIEMFNTEFDKQKDLIYKNLTQDDMSRIKIDYSDSTNILVESIPDELRGFTDIL